MGAAEGHNGPLAAPDFATAPLGCSAPRPLKDACSRLPPGTLWVVLGGSCARVLPSRKDAGSGGSSPVERATRGRLHPVSCRFVGTARVDLVVTPVCERDGPCATYAAGLHEQALAQHHGNLVGHRVPDDRSGRRAIDHGVDAGGVQGSVCGEHFRHPLARRLRLRRLHRSVDARLWFAWPTWRFRRAGTQLLMNSATIRPLSSNVRVANPARTLSILRSRSRALRRMVLSPMTNGWMSWFFLTRKRLLVSSVYIRTSMSLVNHRISRDRCARSLNFPLFMNVRGCSLTTGGCRVWRQSPPGAVPRTGEGALRLRCLPARARRVVRPQDDG